ncbi:hypothetical protein [Litorilituus sediminis]|uniref:hypothetical protein n=1 Tax=Litorilituus sediminis TaxID=718192 RepID=UPI001FEB5E5C|nr:hypothetical protein [Litorilituus sediminis]
MMLRAALAVVIASQLFSCAQDQQPVQEKVNESVKSEYLDSLADTLSDRWQLSSNEINWQVSDSHQDHLEFSGERVSAIIYYGSDSAGKLTLKRKLVWPMLRTIPNDTHASLIHDFPIEVSPQISLNGEIIAQETLKQVSFDGVLTLVGELSNEVTLTRTLSPSTTKPALIEQLTFTNWGQQRQQLSIGSLNYLVKTPADKGVYGSYSIIAQSDKSGAFELAPGESIQVNSQYLAIKQGESRDINSDIEIKNRRAYLASLQSKLQLETPDPILNNMFSFAKIRAAESIYNTKGGLMHGPGGGRYYAAIWANDQAEYINPFFPFLGDVNGNESAINSFRHFARFMNDEGKYIPSSIIAEGTDIWDGAGDRGDCAMIAYGASRYALARADKVQAKALVPLIDWCIDYSFAQQTEEGVIASDSDELEGRFPAGDVNLSTNMLTYGALISGSYVHQELGNDSKANDYQARAAALLQAINSYFAATVQGFETYQYYQGNDKLRAWIALPFSFGVFDRKEGTLAAVLSEHLWSADGIYSEAGNKTFWDRATLYAFRGIFAAKETDTAMRYFKYYSRKRLLGEHVPYAVEAWPEGDQRHLSAESALYARVVTEGIFGIEPTGFKRFKLAPYLPSTWNQMCLRKIQAFGENFDICSKRDGEQFSIEIRKADGSAAIIPWDGNEPIAYQF